MANNIIITPGSASIQFSGSANNDTIRLQVEPSGSVAFYGNSGSLFSIVDQLSGSLMSVNDISGLPIFEVFSDDRVVMGTFGRNTLVVSGSTIAVSGSLSLSGSANITSSWALSSSRATTASFAINAGAGAGFPFTGSAGISGSLRISGSGGPELIVAGESVVSGSLIISGSSFFTSSSLEIYKSGSIVVNIEGSQGQLFSVTDVLSGSLMSVNDITGLPILEVFSDDRVVMGTFGRNSLVVTGSRVGVSTNSPQLTTSVVFDVDGTSAFRQVVEHTDIRNTAASATTINYDLLTGSILWYSVNATGNWTLNFRGTSATSLNSIMEIGQSTAAVFIANNGVVAYAPTAHQIDGTAITPKWQGGSAATAKTNSIEMYSYVIMKTADATFTLFASKLDFA